MFFLSTDLQSTQLYFPSFLMASLSCSLPFTTLINSPNRTRISLSSKSYSLPRSVSTVRISLTRPANCTAAAAAAAAVVEAELPEKDDVEWMSIDNLRRFFELSFGKWTGSFYQFDGNGNLLHTIDTRLSVSSYGEDELMSLIQTLYIKQAQSNTSISGYKEEPEWAEYKIKETNMFTVDKYQQVGFFPNERAFCLRYQTAGMLETILRQGVLGEDDTEEESPRCLKLPSRKPSVVCESCLYSQERDRRVRAFHIMDPKGILEMILIFLEDRGDGLDIHPSLHNEIGSTDRILPFLGMWNGHSLTKRSGVYGATISEAETVALLEMDDKGRITQDHTSSSDGRDAKVNTQWTGKLADNLVTFDKGYQITLLPGGMYMGCPCDIAKSVAESRSFHLEFCWLESPGKRQRLVRTFDMEGLAVSSTYFSEIKV